MKTLEKIASYGAAIVRLDAFAYAPKTPGKKNFLNDPETWELLQKIHALAEPLGLTLLPEIHAAYDEKIYQTLAEKGYATYDFFLPGLVIDAIENRRGTYLAAWAKEIVEKKISTVNMLGCHDGIPLLDLKGLLPKEEIQSLIDRIVSRGGMVIPVYFHAVSSSGSTGKRGDSLLHHHWGNLQAETTGACETVQF